MIGGVRRTGGHDYSGGGDGESRAGPAEGTGDGKALGCDSANTTAASHDRRPRKSLCAWEAGSQKPAPRRFWDCTTSCESEAALKMFHLVSPLIFPMRTVWSGEGM